MKIKQALKILDPKDDLHWTAEGLPRMEVVEGLVGDSSIKRADVTNAAPEFNREEALSLVLVEPEPTPEDSDNIPGSPSTQEPEVVSEEAVPDKDEAYQKLLGQAKELKEELTSLSETIKKAVDHKKGLESKLQKLEVRRLEMYPNISNGGAIREYLKSQHKIKEQRHNNLKEIMKGITTNDLRTMSPLDASMKRPTGYGKKKLTTHYRKAVNYV